MAKTNTRDARVDETIELLVNEWTKFKSSRPEPIDEDEESFEATMQMGELVQIAALLPEDLVAALWTFTVRLEEFQHTRDEAAQALEEKQSGSALVM